MTAHFIYSSAHMRFQRSESRVRNWAAISNAIGICNKKKALVMRKKKGICDGKRRPPTLLASKNGGHWISFKLGSELYGTSSRSISLNKQLVIRHGEYGIHKEDGIITKLLPVTNEIFLTEAADYFIPKLGKFCRFSSSCCCDLHTDII